ncbi:PRC-barrel domain-containing protein [Thermincola ferriacetica]|uniref:PRC-barrel domain-containing protein n=1 Tax=Thermincola ferriacetica TaxID=281456 RepID=A0A0L6VZ92_9FIRM|nr:PRC-barrel domain-containing protein [Thermincola ferriacetica]KNZ68595.1 PRC-barrel domain-containing protein [Thermincola ferriacetica]
MKRSGELLGLAIISLNDGKEVGKVNDLIINPEEGAVECLVVDDGTRYLGVRVLPSKFIIGVGEYAVTIESATAITTLDDLPDLSDLLEKNVKVIGTKVLTKKGKLIGTVSEFYVDEENEGKIVACEFTAPKSNEPKIVPADGVVTFGKDVLVVVEDVDKLLTDKKTFSGLAEPDAQVPAGSAQETEEQQDEDNSEATRLFEERQRQFLLGRKVSKKIETEKGEVLAEEGDIITEELLEKVKRAGKFTELSMNTRS